MAYLTQLYWSSGYDLKLVFYNYPHLTLYQEDLVNMMFNEICDFKAEEGGGNVFPVIN